jgi:hypothetical protein
MMHQRVLGSEGDALQQPVVDAVAAHERDQVAFTVAALRSLD